MAPTEGLLTPPSQLDLTMALVVTAQCQLRESSHSRAGLSSSWFPTWLVPSFFEHVFIQPSKNIKNGNKSGLAPEMLFTAAVNHKTCGTVDSSPQPSSTESRPRGGPCIDGCHTALPCKTTKNGQHLEGAKLLVLFFFLLQEGRVSNNKNHVFGSLRGHIK